MDSDQQDLPLWMLEEQALGLQIHSDHHVATMETWRAFSSFCAAVLSHWVSLSTGGFVIFLLGALEHYTGLSVPWPAYAILIIIFFTLACFLAFRDQFILATGLASELSTAVQLADRSKKADHDLSQLQEYYEKSLDELASTRTELEELKQMAGTPYPFSIVQRRDLVAAFESIPTEQRFKVIVQYPDFGGNSVPAQLLAKAIRDAGWESDVQGGGLLNTKLKGIYINLPLATMELGKIDDKTATSIMNLVRSFESAGIELKKSRSGQSDYADSLYLIVFDQKI